MLRQLCLYFFHIAVPSCFATYHNLPTLIFIKFIVKFLMFRKESTVQEEIVNCDGFIDATEGHRQHWCYPVN